MGQAEQQALAAKQQQAGDHRVATPPPPLATAFHQEIQQQQRPPQQQLQQRETRPVQERVPQPSGGQYEQNEQQKIIALQREQALANQRAAAQQAEITRNQQQQQLDHNQQLNLQHQELQNQARQNQQRPVAGEGRQPYPVGGQPQRGQYSPPDGPGHGFNPNRPPDFNSWGHHDHDRPVFVQVIPFGPPPGERWGWQNPGQWSRGYDSSFFQQDPNYENWQPTISQESQNVSQLLNSGDTQGAATTLNNDLWAMRGDIYGQNELLHEVQTEQTGEGAQLYLGQWDPTRGSWDAIEVQSPTPPPGYDPDPSFNLRTFE